ncbi:helix-turn-helix domain-containing protein [Streptomyces sp. NPDC002790]|uniref:helix-turn-helix domain-containing protein n=1 Tax=Streptomyces sp. NPDC002790 TaxID=3154431 RepID=UPI0033246C86
MDTQHPNAPACAQSPVAGVLHDNTRIAARFTVIGNHLAQHRKLSLTAIGLSVHIQSLPTGARVDIRTLAALFPEGTTRISAALRELEAHGYLRRERRRTPEGRVTTRTISCNHPGARPTPAAAPAPSRPKRPPKPLHVPHPSTSAPALIDRATALLTTLHRADPRLLLSAKDTAHLAPGVAAWLEREAPADAARHALTRDLPPDPIHHPAAFLAHRLVTQLPPLPPFRPPHTTPPVIHPLQNCDTYDRAYRGPEAGRCPSCAEDRAGVAAR